MSKDRTNKDPRAAVEQAYERDMLDKLSMLARGFDMFGGRVGTAEMVAAQQQYHTLKGQIDERRLARDRLEQEKSIEDSRINTQKELEHRRLDIEEERVKVQKAEVIVKALEVAVQGGANPEQLLQAIQGLSNNLLPDYAAPTRTMIEDRRK